MRTAMQHPAAGLVIAVLSAATFGMSGTFARPLLSSGWTPGAAVALRTAAAGAVLLPAAAWAMRGRGRLLLRAWPRLLAFGIVGVAGAQLCYFAAVERLPVGIAILIEFLGPVLVGSCCVRSCHECDAGTIMTLGSAVVRSQRDLCS